MWMGGAYLKETGYKGLNGAHPAQDTDHRWPPLNTDTNCRFPQKSVEFLGQLSYQRFFEKLLLHGTSQSCSRKLLKEYCVTSNGVNVLAH